jgi:hypothetical protein
MAVNPDRGFEQPIGPIFKGQEIHKIIFRLQGVSRSLKGPYRVVCDGNCFEKDNM